MGHRERRLIALAAVLFLSAPWLARAAGVEAEQIENRSPAPAPELQDGWEFFTRLSTYLTDRLPLRKQAVAADAWIDINVFDDAPTFGQAASSEVVLGRAGWMYLADEMDRACSPPTDLAATKANVSRLAAAVTRSGRTFVFVVAPDKSTIVPEYLPRTYPKSDCAPAGHDAVWTLLRDDPVSGFVDLRAPLEREQVARRSPIYLRTDTHWNSLGTAVMAREVVRRVDPRAWDGARVVEGPVSEYTGDLTHLAGLPSTDRMPTFSVSPAGHVEVSTEQVSNKRTHSRAVASATAPSPLIGGRTLFLYDSFGRLAIPAFRQFFADLTTLRMFDLEHAGFAKAVAEADTVVIEVVERELTYRFGQQFAGDEFHAELYRLLRAASG